MPDLTFDLKAIPDGIQESFGLPQPNWKTVYEFMKPRLTPETWAHGWNQIAEQWLTMLGAAMGPEYRVRRSPRFYTLDACADDVGDSLIGFANKTLSNLEGIFADLNRPNLPGQRVIIFFAARRSYYSYVSALHPDGVQHGTSAGMYISGGYRYRHTICAPAKPFELQSTVVHELTHHVLDHLDTPRWLEEGVTKMMQERITGYSFFHLDRELARRHRDHWSRTGLTEFWMGRAHKDPEGQELSYNLSQVFTRRIASDWPTRFMLFIRDAKRADAGNASAMEHLGVELKSIAESFLGPGDWACRTEDGANGAKS
jgi:hypothetical protein